MARGSLPLLSGQTLSDVLECVDWIRSIDVITHVRHLQKKVLGRPIGQYPREELLEGFLEELIRCHLA